jgi:hypothetical protein
MKVRAKRKFVDLDSRAVAESYIHSNRIYWVVGAALVIALLVAAVHWFNYYRIADFEMR